MLTLQARMAHASVAPTQSAKDRGRTRTLREEVIEPELVAVVINMEKHDALHFNPAVLGEVLPKGFSRSCTGSFPCNKVLEVDVDPAIIKKRF
uniref:Uncharacterized protein n=1 Tax=Physcomitrium patens TaxID=3218 RepID=A0A2K1K768_PHYPA|nr:hypothetical protein PHYPA_011515 [Physcomitrium patens]